MAAKPSDPERDYAAWIVARFSVQIHAWRTDDVIEACAARAQFDLSKSAELRILVRRHPRQAAPYLPKPTEVGTPPMGTEPPRPPQLPFLQRHAYLGSIIGSVFGSLITGAITVLLHLLGKAN